MNRSQHSESCDRSIETHPAANAGAAGHVARLGAALFVLIAMVLLSSSLIHASAGQPGSLVSGPQNAGISPASFWAP